MAQRVLPRKKKKIDACVRTIEVLRHLFFLKGSLNFGAFLRPLPKTDLEKEKKKSKATYVRG